MYIKFWLIMLLMIPSVSNSMHMPQWKTHVIYHFGLHESYCDFRLQGTPISDGFNFMLYGKTSSGDEVALDLFRRDEPIMCGVMEKMTANTSEYISKDGFWRLIVGKQITGEHVIMSQRRAFEKHEFLQESLCVTLALWVRSWCKKKNGAL